jgi:hypothetical protein
MGVIPSCFNPPSCPLTKVFIRLISAPLSLLHQHHHGGIIVVASSHDYGVLSNHFYSFWARVFS